MRFPKSQGWNKTEVVEGFMQLIQMWGFRMSAEITKTMLHLKDVNPNRILLVKIIEKILSH